MFSSSFYDQLDPFYRQELSKLETKIKATTKNKRKGPNRRILKLLDDFSSHLLLPNKLWDQKIKITKLLPDRTTRYTIDKPWIAAECKYQLSYLGMEDCKSLDVSYLPDKNLLFHNRWSTISSFLRQCEQRSSENYCFEHLERNWKQYEKHALALPSRSVLRRGEELELLYSKIKSVKDNIEKWFEAITEVNDVEFVQQNVEFRIGSDLTNKKLWKLYIKYLERINDRKKLLETYSKFCRFFISDNKMFREYQKAAKKYGPSIVPWKNAFAFEKYNKIAFISSCSRHFDDSDALPQKLPFKQNLINYIIKNGNASILFDLFKTCKWFYCFYPFAICYNFRASKWETEIIRRQTMTVKDLDNMTICCKIFISTFFTFEKEDVNALSKFIPKIYRCAANYVEIGEQNLSMNEVKFLIGHGDVIDLDISIRDQDGNSFQLEDIIQLVPKIQKFEILYTKYSENISQYLCDFSFQNKIERFCFGFGGIIPEPYAFAEFILKNAREDTFSYFSFFKQRYYYYDDDENDNENDNVKEELEKRSRCRALI